jgi:hypothetical protein
MSMFQENMCVLRLQFLNFQYKLPLLVFLREDFCCCIGALYIL